jgi:hypothetical protein
MLIKKYNLQIQLQIYETYQHRGMLKAIIPDLLSETLNKR